MHLQEDMWLLCQLVQGDIQAHRPNSHVNIFSIQRGIGGFNI